MENYFTLFEKNILDNESKLESILMFEPSLLKTFVNKKLAVEGRSAIKSTAFQKIFELYKLGVENGIMNPYYFRSDYRAKMYDYDQNDFVFFDFFMFYELLTGEEWVNGQNKVVEEKLIKLFLSEDKSFFTLPVAPIVFKSLLPHMFMKPILNAFEFKVPEGMGLTEYYKENSTLLTLLDREQIKKGLAEYFDRINAYSGLYELYMFASNILNSCSDSESNKRNAVNPSVIRIAILEFIFSRNINDFINLTYDYELEEDETAESENLSILSGIVSESLSKNWQEELGNDLFPLTPKIVDWSLEINKLEKELDKKSYSTMFDLLPSSLQSLILKEAIKREHPVAFRNPRFISNNQSNELFKDLVAAKHLLQYNNESVEHMFKDVEENFFWSDCEINPSNMEQLTDMCVSIDLYAIFGDIIKKENEKSKLIYEFLNENINDLFEIRIIERKDNVKIKRFCDLQKGAVDKLIAFKGTLPC